VGCERGRDGSEWNIFRVRSGDFPPASMVEYNTKDRLVVQIAGHKGELENLMLGFGCIGLSSTMIDLYIPCLTRPFM